jgi:hypothetical protein
MREACHPAQLVLSARPQPRCVAQSITLLAVHKPYRVCGGKYMICARQCITPICSDLQIIILGLYYNLIADLASGWLFLAGIPTLPLELRVVLVIRPSRK